MSEIVTEKRCSTCRKIKRCNEFSKSSKTRDGLTDECKNCKKEYDKKRYSENKERLSQQVKLWRSNNIERFREYSKRWHRENKESERQKVNNRRARLYNNGGKLSVKDWKNVLEKYKNKCLCCGRTDKKLTIDHIIPLGKGGKNTVDNVQPLCDTCNKRKATKTIDYRKGVSNES